MPTVVTPLLISLEALVEDRLLEDTDLPNPIPVSKVDFVAVAEIKDPLIAKAAKKIVKDNGPLKAEMEAFRRQPEISGILESLIIHDAAAKDYGDKLMKITELDFNLPKAYTRAMCKEFQVLEYGDMPQILVRPSQIYGRMLYTRKVHISTDEIAIMKFHEGTEVDVRKLVKEVCVYEHLEKLQGYRIPKLLLYGVPGTLCPNIIIGLPRFFFIVKFYGEVLGPSQVSAPELGEILNDIHGHGILLGCREFPRVTRNGSMLMLVDMAEAVFDENEDTLKREFQYLTSLCKG